MAATLRHKPYKGLPMEGPIARWYAKNTQRDTRGYRQTAQAIAARLAPGASVLEVAPGPGYLAIELARLGDYRITGLDISRSFVRIAAANARQAGVAVDVRHGDAAHMPFPAEAFDFVVCRAAFKNFADPLGALNEMHRVLRPGGRASIFDLRKDAPLATIDEEVRGMQLAPWNAWLTRWIFRRALLPGAYSRQDLQAMVARSPFASGEIVERGIELELRLTKESGVGSQESGVRG